MKKMILLPYDRYQRLLSTSVDLTSQPDIALKPEWTHVPKVETQLNEHTELANSHPTTDIGRTESEEDLLQQFPKAMRQKVRSVLHYILPHVTWNDRGEVTLHDHKIPNSNIVDLLKVYLKGYKEFNPVGKDAFGELLLEMNVPRSLLAPHIRHLNHEDELAPSSRGKQQLGGNPLPPPPGLPLKRPEGNTVQQKVKWRRL